MLYCSAMDYHRRDGQHEYAARVAIFAGVRLLHRVKIVAPIDTNR
jgi:hypothetical protein